MDELFTDLVAPLVGIDPVEFHRIPWRSGDDVPVVLLEGGPGTGKTAALEWITERYRNRAPIARVDLADRTRYPEGSRDRLPGLLTDLRWLTPWGLSLEVLGNGRPLRFPRLSFALLAIAAGPPSGHLDDQGARQRLRSALSQVYPQARKTDVTDWVREVLAESVARMAPFPVDVLIRATIAVMARRLFDRARRDAALDWHRDHSHGPGNGLDALIALSSEFARAGLPRDAITNPPGQDGGYPGLSRVSPTTDEEAPALTRFGGVDTKRALLVKDTRTDDDYITTLASAFAEHLSGSPQQPELYTSPQDINQEGETPNRFLQMVPNICESGAKWIYFAGRQVQLRVFINALRNRGCQDRKFTILTGTAASHLDNDKKLDARAFSTGITLDHAAIAHPEAWAGPHVPATGGSSRDYADFTGALNAAAAAGPIGPTGLTDGQTIITHDAVWTAVAEIRGATNASSGRAAIPSLQAVADERRSLHGVQKIRGASGWICLDNGGNPYDKAVPIVQYQANGTPRFITVAWPTGSPPAATCTAPFKR